MRRLSWHNWVREQLSGLSLSWALNRHTNSCLAIKVAKPSTYCMPKFLTTLTRIRAVH